MKYSFLLLLFTIFVFSASLKCKKTPAPPPVSNTEQLPPATQEGKNTCGFLVNGKAWIPKGNNGRKNLSWYYDPSLNSGSFALDGYRYEKAGDSNFSDFVLSINNFKTGNYKLNIDSSKGAEYGNSINYCFYRWKDTITNHNSFVNITKFDTQNRIIAGTFEFTLYKPGCDTVRITQGRFDVKY